MIKLKLEYNPKLKKIRDPEISRYRIPLILIALIAYAPIVFGWWKDKN